MRMLQYVLGVRPDKFGLVTDDEGWAPIKELLKALHQEDGWHGVRESMVRQAAERLAPDVLETQDNRIRCISRQPDPPEYGIDPPSHLFIAVRRRGYRVIREHGLEAGAQPAVALVADEALAIRLGWRKDPDPVLVTVQARKAQGMGVIFALSGDTLYLCDRVPPECLMGPPVPEETRPRKGSKDKKKKEPEPIITHPKEPPGSFSLFPEETEKPYKQKGIKKDIAWKRARRKNRRNNPK